MQECRAYLQEKMSERLSYIRYKEMGLYRSLKSVLFLVTLYTIFYLLFFGDSSNWEGLNDANDATVSQKIFNRVYFTLATFSTTAHCTFYPKTLNCKLFAMSQLLLVCVGFIRVVNNSGIFTDY